MINEMPDGEVEKSFTDYQAETFAHCKSIVKHAQSMVAKVKDTPTEIVTSSRELTVAYSQLVQATQGALATIESDEVSHVTIFSNCNYYYNVLSRLRLSCRSEYMWLVTSVWRW